MSRALAYTWGKFVNIAQLRRHPARAIVFTTAFVGVLAVVMMPILAQAVDSNFLAGLIASALAFFVGILGKLLLLIIYILIQVAQYNDFINSTAVSNGWVIVRDVANMFFIVILLVTAFATILNVESYQWKKILPDLLIAAVLINFSKTIAGIFIDISQVVMLTFVNGFAAAAGGNFTNAFQVSNLLTLSPDLEPADVAAVLGGYVLALLMIIIAIGITIIMTIMLLFRIVMLWTLVVLSPLPYLLKVIPGKGKGMADRWWKDFSENLIAGPVLAFFLWLALVSVGSGNVASQDRLIDSTHVGGGQTEIQGVGTDLNPGGTTAGTPEPFLSFLIAVCMLIAGIKIAGEYSVTGAGALNKFREKLGQKGMGALKTMTGAKYAEALYKIRQGRKEEAFQGRVAKVQAGIGYAQQGIGTGLKYGLGGLGVGAGHVAFGRRAAAAEEEAKQKGEEATKARGQGDYTTAETRDREAMEARKRSASLRGKQRWTEHGVNAVVAGAVTIGTGGVGVIAAPAILGGRGLQGAGKKNVSDAQQHVYKKVNGERDAMKNLKPEDILEKAQGGPDVSKFEQMAAMITAVEKQLVSGFDLDGMETKMGSLGADEKTMSTFKSIADQKYPGTRLTGDTAERQRQLASGRINMKDLKASELADPSFAADIVLNVKPDGRKELDKTNASKAAYKSGLEGAVAKTAGELSRLTVGTDDHKEKQKDLSKIQAEYMRLGGDVQKAFAGPATAGGMPTTDYQAFGKVVVGKGGGEIISNMDVSVMADTNIIQQLADNADPVQIQYALKKARDDGDPDQATALRKLVEDIKKKLHDDMDALTAPGAPMPTGSALAAYEEKDRKLKLLQDRTFRI